MTKGDEQTKVKEVDKAFGDKGNIILWQLFLPL